MAEAQKRSGPKGRPDQEARIQFAMDAIRLQKSYGETVKAIVDKFGCAKRSAYGDMKKAYAQMADSDTKSLPMRKHALRMTLQTILRKALGKNNFNAALKACVELAKIDGLYAPLEVQHGGAVGVEHEIKRQTSNDKRNELRGLFEMYASTLPDVPMTNGKSNGAAN